LHYVGITIYLFHFFSYAYTALINPGMPQKKKGYTDIMHNENTNKSIKICDICNIIMDEAKKTVHCDDCGICIEGILILIK